MRTFEAISPCLSLFPEAILIVDAHGLILYANPAAQRGFKDIRPGATSLLDLSTQPEDRVRDYLHLCSRSSGFCPGRFEIGSSTFRCEGARYQAAGQDGKAHVLLRLTPYQDAVKRFVALNEQIEQLSREVARRRQAEAELTEQRERLRVTLAGIGDAVIATDDAARITFMNPVAEQQTGWPAQEAIGRPVGEVFRIINEENRGPVENPVNRVLREGVIVGLANHTILVRRDGTEMHIDDSGAPIRDAEGRIVGAVLVFHDIGERRRLEQQIEARTFELEDEHRRKDEFLAMLGHELRNPLAPIQTALSLLELSQGDEEKDVRAREVLRRQVSHLVRLVDELLDVARITTGRIMLKTEPVDVHTVASHALEQCEPLLRAKEQHFDYLPAGEPLYVHADTQRLTQAVGNLLHNANRYTPSGGAIRLKVRRVDGEAEIAVEDNGIGIDANVLPQIFDMFRQAGRTLARSEGGLGIGLTLVKRLVELHGGEVSGASAGVGKGSRFAIRLPLTSVPEQADERPQADARRSRTYTVLVVDDNVDAAAMLAEVLQLVGHRVLVAHSGDRALVLAREARPQAVFLDIGLPGMDGYAVARALRRETAGAAMLLVALTGYGQPEDRRKAREAGFDHHLVKPASIDEMTRILEAIGHH